MSFWPLPPVAWCHMSARRAAGLAWTVVAARGLVAGRGAGEQAVDVEALQRRRQQPDGGQIAGAAADPVPHREAGQPALVRGDVVQLRPGLVMATACRENSSPAWR